MRWRLIGAENRCNGGARRPAEPFLALPRRNTEPTGRSAVCDGRGAARHRPGEQVHRPAPGHRHSPCGVAFATAGHGNGPLARLENGLRPSRKNILALPWRRNAPIPRPRAAGLPCPLAAAMQGIAGAGVGADRACTGMRHRRADGRQWRPAATKVSVLRRGSASRGMPTPSREMWPTTLVTRAWLFLLPLSDFPCTTKTPWLTKICHTRRKASACTGPSTSAKSPRLLAFLLQNRRYSWRFAIDGWARQW